MKKGQVIIITALIIVIVLVMIKIESSSLMLREQRTEAGIFSRFDNLKNELLKSGGLGFTNYTVVYDFSSLINDEEDIELFYSISSFIGQDNKLNITVTNFLDEPINSINISQNLTGEMKTISFLDKEETKWVDFDSSPQENPVDIQINITYRGNVTNNVTSESHITRAGKSSYMTIFYDFSMHYGDSVLNDKFSISKTFVYTWREAEGCDRNYDSQQGWDKWKNQSWSQASNGYIIRQANANGVNDFAEWDFNVIDDGEYYFWIRGRHFDGACTGVRLLWSGAQIGSDQDWSIGSEWGWSSYGSFYLNSGTGTLNITNPTDPAWIDVDNILITNDPLYVPTGKGVEGSGDNIIG